MARRTNYEIVEDAVRELRRASGYVTNPKLIEYLGWDPDKYWRIRDQMVDEGYLLVGTGRGGTVAVACETQPDSDEPSKLFISYAHVDGPVKKRLLVHLGPLQRKFNINIWHDEELKAGDDFAKEIAARLEEADIALLLISADYIASSFCYEVELQQALELHEAGDLTIVPVIVGDCAWELLPIGKLQAVPPGGRSVARPPNEDEGLAEVVRGLDKLLTSRLAQ